MPDQPTVSIIMPCLNGEQHIQTAIGSVLAQTFNDFELIVVDNGSTDRTPEILGSINDPRLKVLTLPERGVSRARNLGLRKARGAFIAFLDSDDTWNTEFLEKMHSVLVSDSKAMLAYCGWQNLGLPRPRGEPFIPPDYETPDKAAALLEGCRWPIHACLTRRTTIVAAGGFNAQLTIAEDYLLWLECSAQGKLIRVPEVLAQYHHHGGEQATHNRALAAIDTFRAKQFFLQRHPDLATRLGANMVDQLTWGKLIKDGNALHWQGDIESARPVFRKALLAGKGTFPDKLRMLPSLFPLWLHRAILVAKIKT
ncbi:MAG: glycosyltransferase [Burkholderiales bacterium]|nr:glycosyltransferase [Burkholderiales bacterium]